jgi:hypothetical protein
LKGNSINQYDRLTLEILIPIVTTDEQSSSSDIAHQYRNDSFPDVYAHCDRWGSVPDRDWDEEHVRNNMIPAERDECETWPPDADDLGDAFPAGDSKELSQACQPIRSNAAKEYHVPRWYDLLSGCKSDGFLLVLIGIEDTPETSDDGNYEETTRQVS